MMVKSRLILPALMLASAVLGTLATVFIRPALQPAGSAALNKRPATTAPSAILAINPRAAAEMLELALPAAMNPIIDH
jgi:hypothetical protein